MTKKSLFDRRGAAVAALAGLVAITAAGCGGSGGSSSGNGSLSVLMSDAPPNLGNVTAVNVTAAFGINRSDFGIKYPGMANDLIRDKVGLRLNVKAAPGRADFKIVDGPRNFIYRVKQ